jgi:hypothetical protein
MSVSSYNKQILATQAAATINGDGTTPIAYGCSVTRSATGVYKLILPTGEGLTDAQTFTQATSKGTGSAPGLAYPNVSDESDFIKTVVMVDATGGLVNQGVEIVVQRSTINPF